VPFVSVKLARRDEPATREQKSALIAGITKLLQDVLSKRPEDVLVLIEELDPDNWGQGGQTATALRQQRNAAES